MSQYRETCVNPTTRARRQQEDQRRMRFRRAIESHYEQRRLQEQLMEYPDLFSVPLGATGRRSGVQPVR